MRGIDRDLIRGGHHGQRSREPHQQAEHMAAPTTAARVKKAPANPEPSTHGRPGGSLRRAAGPNAARDAGWSGAAWAYWPTAVANWNGRWRNEHMVAWSAAHARYRLIEAPLLAADSETVAGWRLDRAKTVQ